MAEIKATTNAIKTVWVEDSDLVRAHSRWRESWPCPLLCDWSRFLGELTFPQSEQVQMRTKWAINAKGAERIRRINETPHYYALLRMWAIQYTDEIT